MLLWFITSVFFLQKLTLAVFIKDQGHIHHKDIKGHIYTLSWAIKLEPRWWDHDLDTSADSIAADMGLLNLGKIGHFPDYFLFVHPNFYSPTNQSHDLSSRSNNNHSVEFRSIQNKVHQFLEDHHLIPWYQQQVIRPRFKRAVEFEDPAYPQQWHLHNDINLDINVIRVWEQNITGEGVTVCVVDDGLEWTNEDIFANYNSDGSWDFNQDDNDPSPNFDKDKNQHGTRCAGEIAAVPNKICAVGVAFRAKVSAIKVLDGQMTDSLEATAFNKKLQVNDIFSCSWGPSDDGETIDGPHHLAEEALRFGVEVGRGGYGSIYVVASGNGGSNEDNCNFDGYANSIYTVTIGAVDEEGNMPYYAEECAAMLAVTFSSGGSDKRSIVTTDWTKFGGKGCTTSHSGTSAAAPIAAGILALMLQVRNCLTWRDIQYLIVMTSVKVDVDHAAWITNEAGLHHSHKHGFGLMDAWRLVNAAKVWESVPWQTTYVSEELHGKFLITSYPQNLTVSLNVTSTHIFGYNLYILEYVQVKVKISHPQRGNLVISVSCPSGTDSVLASQRDKDKSIEGFQNWIFTTARCWGEQPIGLWTLVITDKGQCNISCGHLEKWQLILHGTPMDQDQFQARLRLVEETVNGHFLKSNFSLPCQPPPGSQAILPPISDKVLKILVSTGLFLLVLSIYETLEFICCPDEKTKNTELLTTTHNNEQFAGTSSEVQSEHFPEEIPLNIFTRSDPVGRCDYIPLPTSESEPGLDFQTETEVKEMSTDLTEATHLL